MVLGVLAPQLASASVVFDSGPAIPGAGGVRIWQFIGADDFVLAADAALTGGSFVYATSGAFVLPEPVRFFIYADALVPGPDNQPGALLANGLLTLTDAAYIGDPGQTPHYLANFLFDTPFDAQAGVRYWLGLQTDSPDIAWVSSNFNGSADAWEHRIVPPDPDGYWRSADLDATFTLTGSPVPEPAVWAMMIAGFGLAGASIRKRRASVHVG
jgi:hypothetical protein